MNWKAAQMFKQLSGPWKFSRLGDSSSSHLRVWDAFLNLWKVSYEVLFTSWALKFLKPCPMD